MDREEALKAARVEIEAACRQQLFAPANAETIEKLVGDVVYRLANEGLGTARIRQRLISDEEKVGRVLDDTYDPTKVELEIEVTPTQPVEYVSISLQFMKVV